MDEERTKMLGKRLCDDGMILNGKLHADGSVRDCLPEIRRLPLLPACLPLLIGPTSQGISADGSEFVQVPHELGVERPEQRLPLLLLAQVLLLEVDKGHVDLDQLAQIHLQLGVDGLEELVVEPLVLVLLQLCSHSEGLL